MKSHQIKKITSSEIAGLLGLNHLEIVDRELILKNSKTKIIEKIKLRTNTETEIREFFIKYGTTSSFQKEILFYDALSQPVSNQISKLFSYQFNPERYIMVFEWIDGENPDFTKEQSVTKVFGDLGMFAASFEDPVLNYQQGDVQGLLMGKNQYGADKVEALVNDLFEKKRMYDIFQELCGIGKMKEELVKDIGGEKLLLFLRKLENGLIEHITDTIYNMPLTIHPGDVSKFNLLIRNANNKTVVLDFENMKIGPMCLLMEYIGEKDTHVPPEHFSALALQSYLDGWNSKSKNKIDWKNFYDSYICTRIMYKCYLLGWWLKKENVRRKPGKKWISQHVSDLSLLFNEAGL